MSELPSQTETSNADPPTELTDAPNGLPAYDYDPGCLSDDEKAQFAAYFRLMERDGAGELDEYFGEYVLSDGETIFAHTRDLRELWRVGSVAATAAGVSPARLSNYFVSAPA